MMIPLPKKIAITTAAIVVGVLALVAAQNRWPALHIVFVWLALMMTGVMWYWN